MAHYTFNDPHGRSDAARQALLDNRCEHAPKRHRTLGRKKRIAKEKREMIKARNAKKLANFRAYKAAVRAYWQGGTDHPDIPTDPG